MGQAVAKKQRDRNGNGDLNKLSPEDRPAHDWYRFVLSFPPHLVRDYLRSFGIERRDRVLDPFCGTGTTIVECKKLGISSVGVEANPIAHFASLVKVDWKPDPAGLLEHAYAVARAAEAKLERDGIKDEGGIDDEGVFPEFRGWANGQSHQLRTLTPEKEKLLLADSISPLPLHKTFVLLDCLKECASERYEHHELLALAKALVFSISNLHFGPEVGVAPAKPDAPVIVPWLRAVRVIADDLKELRGLEAAPAAVHRADSRFVSRVVEPSSINAVITSPPYPNEKDYTRTTRLESVILGFIKSKADIQALKKGLVRSNTRSVYKQDNDDQLVAGNKKVQAIAEEIETRRVELGKTSGFERMYHRVAKLYFGGMARHLADLRTVLRPGAQLAYVVGDQASYLRVMIRTGQLLAEIAESLGYELTRIDLFRTRLATATKEQLREEVVVIRWPG
jgi:hypothetical protein